MYHNIFRGLAAFTMILFWLSFTASAGDGVDPVNTQRARELLLQMLEKSQINGKPLNTMSDSERQQYLQEQLQKLKQNSAERNQQLEELLNQ